MSSGAYMKVYGSRPTKRRTAREISRVAEAAYGFLRVSAPATVRQTYYHLVSTGLISKTEQAYKALVRQLGLMRRRGELPFQWLADNTRWMRKPATHRDLSSYLASSVRWYRRQLWEEQASYVEIWLEKDALIGVLYPITAEYDVPLMSTRGFASLTFLHSAAETIQAVAKPTYIYLLSDYDPSGLGLSENVERRLREFAPQAAITFERIAVTPDQIEQMGLPTRPTKASDPRAKRFGSAGSVEVDAIPPEVLRELVRDCIERHLDADLLERTRAIESAERDTLESIRQRLWREGAGGAG